MKRKWSKEARARLIFDLLDGDSMTEHALLRQISVSAVHGVMRRTLREIWEKGLAEKCVPYGKHIQTLRKSQNKACWKRALRRWMDQ